MAVQWQRELAGYASWTWERIALVANPEEMQNAYDQKKSVIIVTISIVSGWNGTYKQTQRAHGEIHWLILDELHLAKNRNNKCARALMRLAWVTKKVHLISATILSNSIYDLFVPAVMLRMTTPGNFDRCRASIRVGATELRGQMSVDKERFDPEVAKLSGVFHPSVFLYRTSDVWEGSELVRSTPQAEWVTWLQMRKGGLEHKIHRKLMKRAYNS
ncbi:hypothetical protein HD553DRAFT_342745 [Filobasidium floriforme]|uniref:uncharacterized protein n=1 Tax=Filobasidium floriforme TaxID=5210 RepID=UPI001E8ED88A|nr:uncharacterized protein HD553DRAFT_342745 [Filobasidium floriforme]KAH8083520.1 hypothetical protein HD553DRAFT_342745 [Filobasidium floriforme]